MSEPIEILDDGRTVGYSVRGLLREAIKTMDVPEMRRDTSSDSNIRWLNRNLRINNSQHENIELAMQFVRVLLK